MNRIYFTIILLFYGFIAMCQLSIKAGYGPDHLSQIGDNDHEKFAQVSYGFESSFSIGLGYRKFDNITNRNGFRDVYFNDGTYISGREFARINSSEVYGLISYSVNNFDITLNIGLATSSAESEFLMARVDNLSQEYIYSASSFNEYGSSSNVRAGLDIGYNIKIFKSLYLVPYGRYLWGFRESSIAFPLETAGPIDDQFKDIPEIVSFNTPTKEFFVRNSFIVFGLALKYSF